MTDTTDDTPEMLTGGEVLDGTRGPRYIEYVPLDDITYTPSHVA